MQETKLSKRQAIHWMREHVVFEDKSIKINSAFLKRLNQECRLLPDARELFGVQYKLSKLQKYANEVKPRG